MALSGHERFVRLKSADRVVAELSGEGGLSQLMTKVGRGISPKLRLHTAGKGQLFNAADWENRRDFTFNPIMVERLRVPKLQ